MSAGHIQRIIPITLLVLVTAGIIGTFVLMRPRAFIPRAFINDTKVLAQENQQPQSQPLPKPHLVKSRFQPGPDDRTLTLVFDVSPPTDAAPRVRWRNEGDEVKTLEVRSDPDASYTAVLNDVPSLTDGEVLIEIASADNKSLEIHRAEFALRQHVASGPSSRPSRNGRFVVFTKPEGVASQLRLLIGSGEQPIDKLPDGVTSEAVSEVYSLDLLSASNGGDGWLLTIAVDKSDNKPVIFYLPKNGQAWRTLSSTPVEGHDLIGATFAGAGTYMLVREVSR